jgi:serine/threonine protein kinase
VGDDSDEPFLTPLTPRQDEAPEDVGPGTRLGKYELIKRLSVGGMAEIFLARAVGLPGFQKLVAVKRILPQLADKVDFIEMFVDEARIAATLQHTHIAQTYDVAVLRGNYIIAMEYLHGEDVRSILSASVRAKQRILLEHILQIMLALCSGLHYAHEKEGLDGKPLQIVHRDVSPGNVFVTYEGDVKLLDFGIASAATQAREGTTGSIKGKVSYMSPEQARGDEVDRRTDVWAAGVILYELSLGRKLYRGTDYEILNKIVKGEIVPPHDVDPGFDPKLEQIVLRALRRDREERYQTALEMQLDLEALARERGLFLSTTGLKSFMSKLFGQKLDAWREAQKQGKSLVDHLQIVASYDGEAEPLPEPPPPKRRTRWVIGLVAAGGLAALVGGTMLRSRKGAAPSTGAPSHVESVPAPAAPAAPTDSKPSRDTAPPSAPVSPTKSGSVKVVTHPHGASLSLDGQPAAQRSPFTFDQLSPGEHTVVAQLPGHNDLVKRFNLASGDHPTLTLFLVKADRAHAPTQAPTQAPKQPAEASPAAVAAPKLEGNGTLAIASNPWCTVTIDGTDRGQTPLNVTLPAGTHAVTLTNPDYKIRRQLSVKIAPNETLHKKLDFTE